MTTLRLDEGEFEKLYREHHARVLSICCRMLGSPDQAEDAANEVFARLPGSLRTYDPAQPFERWIARVAGNYCIDVLRKRATEMRLLEPADGAAADPPAPAASPLHQLLSQEEADIVRDAMISLPERYLVPLGMRYYSDLSYDEIAQTLGVSRATVAVLIFRAKQRLRRNLSQAAGKHPSPERGRRADAEPRLRFPLGALAPAHQTLAQL